MENEQEKIYICGRCGNQCSSEMEPCDECLCEDIQELEVEDGTAM